MLWKQTNAMDERIRYVVRAEQAGKRLGERSDEFGVHRATGWRWRRRLQEAGGTIEYLAERSRRPHRSPREVRKSSDGRQLRRDYGWGALKLRALL
ncbi:MAG: leucine zipper domain-containing protein, partial [Bryobacteraceae bacterium]